MMDDAKLLDEMRWAQATSSKQILLEGNAPEKTIELTQNAQGFASRMTLLILEDTRLGQLACRKGCSYCCHLAVETTVPEAMAIAAYIGANFSAEEKEQLSRRVEEFLRTTDGMSRKERLPLRTPCPLLRDGECSVYEARPIACRNWHSFDVEACRRDFESPSLNNLLGVNGMALAVGDGIEEGMRIALRSQSLDCRSVELVRAVKIALEDPSLLETWRDRPRAFDSAVGTTVHVAKREEQATEDKAHATWYRQVTNRPGWSEINPAIHAP
jgi:Fe-S-cluster containining protein